eukprot:1188368-Prorocentrum_minimum.AAC.2
MKHRLHNSEEGTRRDWNYSSLLECSEPGAQVMERRARGEFKRQGWIFDLETVDAYWSAFHALGMLPVNAWCRQVGVERLLPI